jgi:hypothetical protein
MGYCGSSSFFVNGWRIAYINNGSAYLISAGASECLCTNSDGTNSNILCSSSIKDKNLAFMHIDNLKSDLIEYTD